MLRLKNLHYRTNPLSTNHVKNQWLNCLYTSNRNNSIQCNHPNRTKVNPQDLAQVVAVILMVNWDLMTVPTNTLHGVKIVIAVYSQPFSIGLPTKIHDSASTSIAHV